MRRLTDQRMCICVSNGYTARMSIRIKDSGLRLRVERELREEFVETCRAEGRVAAQVLREYMREYVARNRAAAQRELFTTREAPVGR